MLERFTIGHAGAIDKLNQIVDALNAGIVVPSEDFAVEQLSNGQIRLSVIALIGQLEVAFAQSAFFRYASGALTRLAFGMSGTAVKWSGIGGRILVEIRNFSAVTFDDLATGAITLINSASDDHGDTSFSGGRIV